MEQNTAAGMAIAEKYLVDISGATSIDNADKKKNQTKKMIDFFVRWEPIPTPANIFPIENKITNQPTVIIK